ncbi:CopG protein [Cyanobacterium sp. HL-69]|uniref:DUF411 domain-containing protein n=1 Tax=Cyanobacterium sp. HL-69 TaxID=2054282 RepID=UPI000CA1CB71|nr:CopG protein [Cyanobacterium sp. HL-69]
MKLFQNLAIISIVTIIAAVGFRLNSSTYAEGNQNNQENQVITASVWETSNVNYEGINEITVYRSPSCGCCGQWISHIEKHGFEVKDIKTDDMETIKRQNNLPSELASCHTAIIDGYVMEGHIPADDIKRFLSQKSTMKGLAVPNMPIGSPGMESNNIKQPFAVLSFNNQGDIAVFNEYENY